MNQADPTEFQLVVKDQALEKKASWDRFLQRKEKPWGQDKQVHNLSAFWERKHKGARPD